MLIRERERVIRLNWIAILAYTGSVGVSLAIWAEVFHAVGRFVR